jgi:formate-dependent nitrite reductase membrane component NrfD
MTEEFTVDYRLSEGFDSLIALNFALEGSGAALMACSVLSNFPAGVIAGLVFVISGLLILLWHLGSRMKSWRVFSGFKNAWTSRGAFFATGLVLFGALYFLSFGEKYVLIVKAGMLIFGLLTILYSGFLLSSMTSIPFWNSPLTPILFLLHSITTGVAILILMLVQGSSEIFNNGIFGVMVGFVGVTLVFTLIHMMVMSTSTNAARESVRLLLKDKLKWYFIGGTIVIGLITPLILFTYVYFSAWNTPNDLVKIVSFAAGIRIIGDYAFRSSILRAGVYELLI